MSAMPSLSLLQAALGQECRIEDALGHQVPVTVLSALPGVAMSARHVCYAVVLVLPSGVQVGQGTYRLRHPDGQAWDLFMTPIFPQGDGRHRLECVIHRERTADDPAPLAATAKA